MLTYTCDSVEATQSLAACLGRLVRPGDLLTMTGDLGAGKTTFTQGLAHGLGVEEPVSSPTFTIIKEYEEGRIPLYHMDIYRLGAGALDEDLGFEEYFYGDGVTVVEWAEWLEELLPEDRVGVTIRLADGGGRVVSLQASGARSEVLLKELSESCPMSR
ncbi:MAG TPA: tRNA (adenosine(37)-N6)-threonylcarbamoyltransferase complex ATPase subunit type 1 TsaE [Bacilli bacterium]|nr:tRNA (adenosine(37)-N6)-threonylcarbamoyltransferase complex ATPase subunit type 1 TsaE [Bacilli bacterium]